MEDGTSVVLKNDARLAAYKSLPVTASARAEPSTTADCPKEGSLIRVLIRDAWHSCTVKRVSSATRPFTFVVEYDDGMLVEDRLSLLWDYVCGDPSKSVVANASRDSTTVSVGAGAVSVRAGEEDAASGAAKRPSTAASRESASLLHATAKAGDVALSRALGYGGVVEYL